MELASNIVKEKMEGGSHHALWHVGRLCYEENLCFAALSLLASFSPEITALRDSAVVFELW
jgi:hypothetical protein